MTCTPLSAYNTRRGPRPAVAPVWVRRSTDIGSVRDMVAAGSRPDATVVTSASAAIVAHANASTPTASPETTPADWYPPTKRSLSGSTAGVVLAFCGRASIRFL